ncbi:MAG: toll/interleukin-1 receptor domain-containing protein, partial [Leptolyngbyaceae bacterium]|nr:toll/interleukin-1 receptor domain-containing protein [Leptolyngbyaceae bacterium]
MPEFYDAFISYGRPDSKAFAVKLRQQLSECGYRVWLDLNDIPLGVDYQRQIDDDINRSHNFLFIMSPHAVNSDYCRLEIEQALTRHKRIIPILHVEEISEAMWWDRNPGSTDADWEACKAQNHQFGDVRNPKLHPVLRKINWVYMRDGHDDCTLGFNVLTSILERHRDYVQHHTQLLVQALTWKHNQRRTQLLLIGNERDQAEAWLKMRFKDGQPPCTPTDLQCEFITESIKNSNNLMTRVFIAYADDDALVMQQVRRSLWREGITVWTSASDIHTGEDFQKAIEQGIEQADNVIYLLSPASVTSAYCQHELEYAIALHKRIIPMLVRPTDLADREHHLPKLKGLQYIDLTDNRHEEDDWLDESQLLRILKTDESYYQTHKVLLVNALKWERQQRNPSILFRGYNLRQAETWLKTAQKRSTHPPTDLQTEFIEHSLHYPPPDSLDVFISYSRSDSGIARQLNENLQIYGKLTWFDQESIAASSADFQQEIYRGIETADNFLFLLSPKSVNSPYCADEVEYAAK